MPEICIHFHAQVEEPEVLSAVSLLEAACELGEEYRVMRRVTAIELRIPAPDLGMDPLPGM